jgi:hypothetical protein
MINNEINKENKFILKCFDYNFFLLKSNWDDSIGVKGAKEVAQGL